MLGGLFDDSPLESSGKEEESAEKPQKADSNEFLLPYFADHSSNFVQLKVQIEENRRKLAARSLPKDESEFNRRFFRIQNQIFEKFESQFGFSKDLKSFAEVSGNPGGFSRFLLNRDEVKGTFYHFKEIEEVRTLLLSREEKNLNTIELNYENVEEKEEKVQFFSAFGWTQLSFDEEAKYSSLSNNSNPKFCAWNGGLSLSSKMLLVSQIRLGFSVLSQGGNFLLLLSDKETLFVSSLLVLLLKNFKSFKMWKNTSDADDSSQSEESPATVFDGFRGGFFLFLEDFHPQNGISNHLKKVFERLKEGRAIRFVSNSLGEEIDETLEEEAKRFVVENGNDLVQYYDPLWTIQLKELELLKTAKERRRKEKESKQSRNFRYIETADTNGIIHHLVNSEKVELKITNSGMGGGNLSDFISRERVQCYSTNKEYSWFCVDLGETNQLIPTHYTMGYANDSTSCSPKHWILQGGNSEPTGKEDYSKSNPPSSDPNWITLSIHENDTTLSNSWALHSWRILSKSSFRFYRVVQTGPNGNSQDANPTDNWSNVFVVNRFELYGTLLAKSVGPVNGLAVNPKTYGVDPNVYIQPDWIRADNSTQREIVEILEYFIQQAHGQVRTENVTVHDIVIGS